MNSNIVKYFLLSTLLGTSCNKCSDSKNQFVPKPIKKSISYTKDCLREVGRIPAISKCIQFYGRTFSEPNSNVVSYDWPGVYFKFNFISNKIELEFRTTEKVYFDIYLNSTKLHINKNPHDPTSLQFESLLVIPEKTNYLIAKNLDESKIHTLRVIKRSETNQSLVKFLGINLSNKGYLKGYNIHNGPKFEFIGDSITVGYGLDSPSKVGFFTQDESGRSNCKDADGNSLIPKYTNTNQSYASIVSKYLGAEYQINAFSGLGLARNFSGSTKNLLFPKYYKRTLVSKEAISKNIYLNSDWNPQYVFVNLGYNDFSKKLTEEEMEIKFKNRSELAKEFQKNYKIFIDEIFSKYPKTHVIAMATNLEFKFRNEFINSVNLVVAKIKNEGRNINFFDFESIDLFGCDHHPAREEHLKIAKTLAEFVQSLQKNPVAITKERTELPL